MKASLKASIAWFTLQLILNFSKPTYAQNTTRVNIGIIARSISIATYAGAYVLAMQDLQQQGYCRNVNFSFVVAYQRTTSPTDALSSAIQLTSLGVNIIMGPVSTTQVPGIAYYVSSLNVPWWNGRLTNGQYNQTNLFTTAVTFSSYADSLGIALGTVFQTNGWTTAAIIQYSSTAASGDNSCLFFVNGLTNVFSQIGVTITVLYSYTTFPTTNVLQSLLLQIQQTTRFIIICGNADSDYRTIMLTAYNLSMVNDQYQYFATVSGTMAARLSWWQAGTSDDIFAFPSYLKLMIITFDYIYGINSNVTFNQMAVNAAAQPPLNLNVTNTTTATTFMALYYDTMYMYGLMLNAALSAGWNYSDGGLLLSKVANFSFTGKSGNVQFSSTSNRVTSAYLWCLDPNARTYNICIYLSAQAATQSYNFVALPGLTWNTANNLPPANIPTCGYTGTLCQDNSDSNLTIIIVCSILAIALACLAVFFTLRVIQQRRKSEIWRIDPACIIFKHRQDFASTTTTNSFSESSSYAASDVNGSSSRAGTDIDNHSSHSGESSKIDGLQNHKIELAEYNGEVVVVKRIKHLNPLISTRECLNNLIAMTEMRHPNVATFYGACVGDPLNLLIVSAFGGRGSLRDVLRNYSDFKREETFTISFIHDLVKGMIYIHESMLGGHGNLKTTNCIIDIRWTLKVGDFGLDNIRYHFYDDHADASHVYRDMYWTAPERLREMKAGQGLKAADVYSFAIILYEILYEQEPYVGENPQGVVANVRAGGDNPYRPKLGELSSLTQYAKIMMDGWNEDPNGRPTFEKIRSRLKQLAGGRDIVLVDEMLVKMEKYTAQLEETVLQRTAALAEEKKKADSLLLRMLPLPIAESLKVGRVVAPESYDCVTLMFTDIVRFTCICANSSPVQIVSFLNTIYGEFDAIIQRHDAYKVETIGDAYMIASGLPVRNGMKHAQELADTALDFISTVMNFRIPHLPEVPLMIRAGLDSGPCCAGVIGNLMPHYCLFGDTVNTASRMESHGLPLRIHVSESCKRILDAFGNYVIKPRGAIEVKGKGTATTFWLINKHGYTGRLPTEEEYAVTFDSVTGLPQRCNRTHSVNEDKSKTLTIVAN